MGTAGLGAAGDNFFLISVGTYADAAALNTAGLTGNAARDFGASVAGADTHILVAYVSSVSGNVRIAEATLADAGGFVADSVADLVELVGVTSLASITTSNFITD